MIYCKSCAEPPSPEAGKRILIGPALPHMSLPTETRPDARVVDLWLEALAPSTELMQWAEQHINQPDEFRQTYFKQLSTQPEHWLILLDYARQGNLTLLCALPNHLFYLEILAGFLEDELEKWQEASSPVCYAGLNPLH